jgi:hypothetical protein
VIALPFVLFGLVFWMRARRKRLPPTSPQEQAEQLYLGARRLLGWAGLAAPASVTPDEFLNSSAALLRERGSLPAALEQVTALYRQAVFSPRPPSSLQISETRRFAERAWPQWLRLVVGRVLKRKSEL